MVDAAEPGSATSIVWNGEIKGFGCACRPGRTKEYILNGRRRNGPERRMTIRRLGMWTPELALHGLAIACALAETFARMVGGHGDHPRFRTPGGETLLGSGLSAKSLRPI